MGILEYNHSLKKMQGDLYFFFIFSVFFGNPVNVPEFRSGGLEPPPLRGVFPGSWGNAD
jgi:hypothetical protein